MPITASYTAACTNPMYRIVSGFTLVVSLANVRAAIAFHSTITVESGNGAVGEGGVAAARPVVKPVAARQTTTHRASRRPAAARRPGAELSLRAARSAVVCCGLPVFSCTLNMAPSAKLGHPDDTCLWVER